MLKLAIPSAAILVVSTTLVGTPAVAAPTGVVGAELTWRVHECAFTGAFVTFANPSTDSCRSIREDQTTSGDVSATDDGWRFSHGIGRHDASTGSTTLDFVGSIRFGNSSLGNYYIELANPRASVDATGAGSLTAEVAVKSPGNPTPASKGRVEIVDLPNVPSSRAWTVTPPWDGVGTPDPTAPLDGKQFSPEFIDALDPSMRNWFRASTSAQATPSRADYNALKAPAPVSVSFPETTWTPTLQVANVDGIKANESRMISISGAGFDPAKQGGNVAGLYVVYGPNPATTTNGYTDQNIFGAAQYLPAGPNAQGEFQTTLTITGTYRDGNGKTWNPASTQMGVSVWAAHTRGTTAWDSFEPITFTVPKPVSKPAAVRNLTIRAVRGNHVTFGWRAPARSNRHTLTRYQVRLSKRNQVNRFRNWISVPSERQSTTLAGVRLRGKYRVQVRAINQGGPSPVVSRTFIRR